MIAHRVLKSRDTFHFAVFTAERKEYLFAVRLLYYSAFYMVTALLKKNNLRVKSHNGVRIFVHQELKMKNLVTLEESQFYDRLYNERHEADYADFVTFEEETVKELIEKTKSFIDTLEEIINYTK
ncbi:MAG TPA: HEPN domain-containing protein [Chitinophagaceae bacterium]|nr:HEPN domain-containing protein [Chitinophagaceae bacterium]